MAIPNPSFNIWEHSQTVRELYATRANGQGEMDAAAQAAEILAPFIQKSNPKPRLLDAGCGSGYLWHSFQKHKLNLEYHGLDYSPSLIEIGQQILPSYGLPESHLKCGTIEDLQGESFDLVVLINTLSFCPDFRQPLDRLASTNPQIILIRDNFGPETIIRWELDGYLDAGYNHLKAYWNQWSIPEVSTFLADYGYNITPITDRRTAGLEEMVVGKSYFWSWLLATRNNPFQTTT